MAAMLAMTRKVDTVKIRMGMPGRVNKSEKGKGGEEEGRWWEREGVSQAPLSFLPSGDRA